MSSKMSLHELELSAILLCISEVREVVGRRRWLWSGQNGFMGRECRTWKELLRSNPNCGIPDTDESRPVWMVSTKDVSFMVANWLTARY